MAKLRAEYQEKIDEKRKLIDSGASKNAVKKAKTELSSFFKDFTKTAKERAKIMADSAMKKLKNKGVQGCPDKINNKYGTVLPKEGNLGNWSGDRGDSDFKIFSGKTIEFKNGFPDFSPFVYPKPKAGTTGEVKIAMTGNNETDFRRANEAMAEKIGEKEFIEPDGYVWHHKEDGVTMQLVLKDVNNPAEGGVPHSGGASVAKNDKKY